MINSQLLFIYVLKLFFQGKNKKKYNFIQIRKNFCSIIFDKKQKINTRRLKIEYKNYLTLDLDIDFYSKPSSSLLLCAIIEKIIAGIPSKAQIIKNS